MAKISLQNQANTVTLTELNALVSDDDVVGLANNQSITGVKTMTGLNNVLVNSSGLTVRNPSDTFKYTITGAAIAADRILNLPLTTATDTLAALGAVQTFTKAQRASENSLTSSAASIAVDLSLSNDFTHTFTENTTLANPTNIVAGQSGAIRLTQHASSPKTLAYGSYYKFPGGTVPTVTATNSAADTLYYYVRSATFIECNLVKGFA